MKWLGLSPQSPGSAEIAGVSRTPPQPATGYTMRSRIRMKDLRSRLVTSACLIGVGLSIAGCSSERGWSMSNRRPNSSEFAGGMGNYRGRPDPAELAAPSGRAGSRATTVENYHRLGILADREQRYQEAESYYRRALAVNPTDGRIWNDLGYSYLLQGRLQEAELALGRAVALDPKDGRARNNLGLVLGHQGRMEEALNEFRLAGSEADAQRNLAMVSRTRGRYAATSAMPQPPLQPDPRSAIAPVSLETPLLSPPPSPGPIPTQDRNDGVRWVPYEEPGQPFGVPSVPNQAATAAPNWSPNVTNSVPSVGGVPGRRTLSSTQTSNPAVGATQSMAPITSPQWRY